MHDKKNCHTQVLNRGLALKKCIESLNSIKKLD